MTMLYAKDNELTYVWRRGGVCQECRSGCRHQYQKKTGHIREHYRCHCYKWNKTKTEKISTAVASIEQKQGARYRISSVVYIQTLQKHCLKKTAQTKESCRIRYISK